MMAQAMVRVHHPLQQGLRPSKKAHMMAQAMVRVHHPLQQGLRPALGVAFRFEEPCECIIHYNKD